MYKPQVFKFRLPFDDSDCGGNGCVDDNAVFDRVRAILDKSRTFCFTLEIYLVVYCRLPSHHDERICFYGADC